MAFDEAYFRRLYLEPATRVHGATEIDRLARGVTGLCEWFGLPIGHVLEVGAGTGLWRDWFRANRPDAVVRTIDVSEHACQQYGHEHRDITTWCEPDARFELIVCQGVLGYLDDAACAAAIEHLAAMSAGFLYVFVTTRDDLDRDVVDRVRTDLSGHVRPARFYFDLLEPYFTRVGAGLFVHHQTPVSLFALERAD